MLLPSLPDGATVAALMRSPAARAECTISLSNRCQQG